MSYRGRVPNAETLGLMLQQGRLARGLSQRELAAELGLTQRWVSEMEAGKPGKLTERLFAMLESTGVRLYAELDEPSRERERDGDHGVERDHGVDGVERDRDADGVERERDVDGVERERDGDDGVERDRDAESRGDA
ncbi:helix-turn-helix domain-containing protein [Agromyces sp. ZXT2-3]|uniref:helix-turn-helix domain-containing protein n=1 Tax=Agromyces sp. ZXT2-3 TaxID=3461152 RepID=UPI0040551F1E